MDVRSVLPDGPTAKVVCYWRLWQWGWWLMAEMWGRGREADSSKQQVRGFLKLIKFPSLLVLGSCYIIYTIWDKPLQIKLNPQSSVPTCGPVHTSKVSCRVRESKIQNIYMGWLREATAFFIAVFCSTEGPDLTHATEIGNYTTTTIPTYQLIDVSVPKHGIGGSQGHKRQSFIV